MTDPTAIDPAADANRYFVRSDPRATRSLFPGVAIRATAGEAIMLSLVTFDPGTEVPDHAHPHEQMGMMISGRLEFTVGGVTQILNPGDIWRIPGGVPHRARAIAGPAVALDVFHPIREDYRD